MTETASHAAWMTIADARRAAAEFNGRFDGDGAKLSNGDLTPYRIAFGASSDAAREEFLWRVASHITRGESCLGSDGIHHAASLLVRWFLAARR